ncbi:MAG: glycosyltransferase family 2 protein [Flavobacteriales bacterium]
MSDYSKDKISFVIPIYNAAKTVERLIFEITNNCEKINVDFEVILVDDCGHDNSWDIIEQICLQNTSVKAIKLSRNFGQHAAITAGLEIIQYEYVVVMDCDLQDRPDQIPKLYDHIRNTDADIVLAKRTQRQDSLSKRLSSKYFYKTLSYFTNTTQDSSVANYGIYRKQAIDEVVRMGDFVRFFPLFIRWVGFNIDYIEVQHSSRDEGKSNYTLRKLWTLALDNIISFSNKPLYLTINLGLIIIVSSFLGIIINLYKYFTGSIEILGYTSIIVIFSFLFGIVIFILGVIGIYIAKIFDQVKGRQIYIIKKKLNI